MFPTIWYRGHSRATLDGEELDVGHRKQNLPRAFGAPPQMHSSEQRSASRGLTWARVAAGVLLMVVAIPLAHAVLDRTGSQAAAESRVHGEVASLLAGIPQHERTLGDPAAPVTLQVFIDLKDPDCRWWFLRYLPAIVHSQVRTGRLKLEYHAYKTNTFRPQVFVKEQTAALAAGAQNKLWNFVDTFYYEQRSEFRSYVDNAYIANIARQVPGLNLARWHTDLSTGRREEQTTAEDHTATTLGLYVTPSFRIGLTGGTVHNYSGVNVVKYPGQPHPIALPQASDISKTIEELSRRL
jgi:protein-disulfide isomerase